MDIWRFQTRLAATLLGWAVASIGAGIALSRRGGPFHTGMGEQFAGWGVINGAIAAFGASGAQRRKQLPDADLPDTQTVETRKLRRLLWVNTGLDVFYMLGGLWLMRSRGATDERWRGRGLGIVIQGGFLFFFDLIHALRLPQPASSE